MAAYTDPELLNYTLEFSKKFNIDTFFETGTYHGDSARIASRHFKRVITVENDSQNYNISLQRLAGIENCELHFGNSPEIMDSLVDENSSNIFFFLDAHWYDYWPLLDELAVITKKKIKPVIAIHDFFVPDGNGNAKFGYDVYRGQPLNLEYIKSSIEKIYGETGYGYRLSESSTRNSGVIYIYPIV